MSMQIEVRTALYITKILGGRSVTVDIPQSSTLHDLLREMVSIYGQAFSDAVCTEDGYDAHKVAVLLNGTSVAAISSGVDTPLKPDDDVLIMPIISGG